MAQKMNMVIAQSGGPSMVINQSLVGAVLEARKSARIGNILGARHGILGILGNDYIDLRKPSATKLQAIAETPSSALGSCRRKPDAADCRKIFEQFRKLHVGYFFYIGGNDSADAARIVAEEAEKDGYPLVVYHIPKTIDNDLRSCDHTPGFGSAARFVASAIKGDDLDNRALGGVKIDVIMGRDAGFLTAASALARANKDDGPHLIYLPEVPFTEKKFIADVKAAMKKYGRCVCAVSEGIRGKDGIAIGAKLADGEKDSHGNVQMSGTGALGDALAKLLKAKAGVKRVRADTFGYLQRSFPGIASKVDQEEAFLAGQAAVRAALASVSVSRDSSVSSVSSDCSVSSDSSDSSDSRDARDAMDSRDSMDSKDAMDSKDSKFPRKGTIAIVRENGKKYRVAFAPVPIVNAAKYTRSVPKEYIAKNGHDVTPAFIDYAKPIVGELPACAIF